MRIIIGVFSLRGDGSDIGSKIREKYLDRPPSSPRHFPTTFKRSILRRIDGLELIYRAAAPPLILGTLSFTRYLERKYVLNVNNLINISHFMNPPNCRINSPVGSWRWLFPALASPEPEISLKEIYPYVPENNAPGLNLGRSEDREKPSDPGRKSPMIFHREFASFREEGCGTARQRNVYLRGTSQGTFVSSGGRSWTIPTFDLLHKYRSRDGSSIISGRGTRPEFEERNRSDTNESDGQRSTIVTMPATDLLHKERPRHEISQDRSSTISGTWSRPLSREPDRSGTNGSVGRIMIFVPEALATIREISPKSFGLSSTVGADLEMMTHPHPIVHGDPSAMRWPPLSRGGDPEGVMPQIFKPVSGNLPSLDFAEDLRRNVPGRNSAASDPRMTYRRYPELEHVEPVETKTIREVDLLREKKPGPDSDRRSIDLNLDRISDQVYSMIERRIRTERERRGLYG